MIRPASPSCGVCPHLLSRYPGRRVPPAWPDWAPVSRSPGPPPSTLQALRLGPISCQGRGPLPGLPRSSQRWHPGPGAHNGPRPSPPSPLLPGPLPVPSPPPQSAGGSAGLLLSPQPALLGALGPPPRLGGARRPLLRPLPGSPRSFASDFFRGSFSRPRRRDKVFLSSGSAMLGPRPGRVRARVRPRRPSPAPPVLPRPPRAPRHQEAHSGNAWPKLFFFPFPRPERAMLGDVVARAGRGGKAWGALRCLPGLQLLYGGAAWVPLPSSFPFSLSDGKLSWLYLQNASCTYPFSSPSSIALTWCKPWHYSF